MALQFQMIWKILDVAIFAVHISVDAAYQSTWINTQGFHHFQHFGPSKTYSRIRLSTLPIPLDHVGPQ